MKKKTLYGCFLLELFHKWRQATLNIESQRFTLLKFRYWVLELPPLKKWCHLWTTPKSKKQSFTYISSNHLNSFFATEANILKPKSETEPNAKVLRYQDKKIGKS